MPQGNPQPGERYLHFKNRLYEVTAIALHSETLEKYVVYRQLYGDHETYIRPYDMFISEVDRDKYPAVTQKYRFKYMGTAEEEKPETDEERPESGEERPETGEGTDAAGRSLKDEGTDAAGREPGETSEDGDRRTRANDDWVDRILDARTSEERYDIVCSIHGEITDSLIDDIATVLDLSIPEGDTQERYKQLKDCMKTIRKYESDRLR